MESIWLEFGLIVVAILANGVFSGSEIALVSARISRLAELRAQGVRGAGTAMQLKETPETFLATIQVAITAVGTLASVVGGAAAIEALTPWLMQLGLGGSAELVALGSVILAITFVSLVLGELTPKAIALRDPERIACLTAPLIAGISRLSAVIVRVLNASTDLVLTALRLRSGPASPFVSEAEVRYLVREGARKGIFEQVEEELVHNVFEFADTPVREIMTPRPRIAAVAADTPPDAVLARVVATAHSRIPVYEGTLESVVGILTLRDVMDAVARGEPLRLPALLRRAFFVPETIRISPLLRQLQQSGHGIAMVVDEHGSVVGLVTVQGVLEEIVGEIREQGERRAQLVVTRDDGSVVLEGMTPIDEAERSLDVSLPRSRDHSDRRRPAARGVRRRAEPRRLGRHRGPPLDGPGDGGRADPARRRASGVTEHRREAVGGKP